ncbi:MAG TPA: non-canonical purine NTP pyrophosphatase [Candidatus Saccharimonadales bacterium]|nr:non-canonical purine NTP pyrophosphatase [Candidatus Saccharimonadales bacterium]
MHTLVFATGNDEKFEIAQAVCAPLGLPLVQRKLDIDEIQDEDSERIVRDKARKAFEQLKLPVVVSDDSWNIPGLNGFPGPYMKSIDHWFTPQDFLNLTRPLADRRIILIQLLAFQDEQGSHVIHFDHAGTLLTEARGRYGKPLQKVVTMPGDNGLSIAEAYDRGTVHAERDVATGWRELAAWLSSNRP